MADYKIVDAEKLNSDLSAVANSIREKVETGGLVFPDGFISSIDMIKTIINDTRPNVITENGTHETDGYSHINVNVQPSDEYIKKSDTWNYTTQFAYGTHKVASDTLVTNDSINIGFKPKIFLIRNKNSVSSNSSRYYLLTSVSVVNNDYNFVVVYPDGSTKTNASIASGLHLTSSKATSAQSNSVNNLFHPTNNGVAGNNATTGTTVYLKANVEYFWFAWG